MTDIAGPHHSHPLGEIDLIMPLEGDPASTADPLAGWCARPEAPIVRRSARAWLALYLLPEGQIQFTR